MKKLLFTILLAVTCALIGLSQDHVLWRGSMTPYDLTVVPSAAPDSLQPLSVVHVARHGARYLTSPSKVESIGRHLSEAAERNTITYEGQRFRTLLTLVDSLTDGRWGLLDSVGYQEERTLAGQLRDRMGDAMRHGAVQAWATYVPRAIMSMYAYVYRLAMLSPYLNIQTHEGPRQDPLLRYFDTDSAYVAYLDHGPWREVCDRYMESHVPLRPATALVGTASGYDDHTMRGITMEAYDVIRALDAMGVAYDPSPYFTDAELMECWKAANLRHYLARSRSRLSDIPAVAARPLLDTIVADIDCMAQPGGNLRARMYFAHAETLMPLFSLMRLPGCDAPDAAYDDVWRTWRDTDIVPLAANLDIELYRAPDGAILISTVLNSRRIAPGADGRLFVPWPEIRQKWTNGIQN